ncbi:uncharacterized protein LOC135836641 [Planococcus citri]|uniref:uncharacterized protein LOC135836641 n=1 Tax=Planococcus citri TaxID=170843 RepID=UPI0031F9DFB4
MASSNLDDLMPRPLLKPSPMEEICARPEVPEVSLVFDCASGKSNKINSPLAHQSRSFQQSASLLDTNDFILERHYQSLSSSKSPTPSSLANTALRTPLKLDDRGVFAAKKVSFSPHGLKNDSNTLELNATETHHHKNENAVCPCNHETIVGLQHHHNPKCTSDERKACHCTSCSNDSLDYSWEHSTSIQRILKNFERKMNTKVSYDDLQKTELKIENILLKHKCKYDKLGENCITRDEFNRVIKNYESQINLLQLRVEELTQKLSYSSHFIGSSCNNEMKKCNYTDDLIPGRSPSTPVINAVKCPNHECCSSNRIPNGNILANGKHYVNDDAVIPTNNYPQFNGQPAKLYNQILQQTKSHSDCCRNQGNFQNIDHRDALRERPLNFENHVMIQTTNTQSPPKQYDQTPLTVQKSNTNQHVTQQSQHSSNQPPHLSHDHQLTLKEKNEDQLLGSENIRVDWTFYNNIVEDVKNLMQKNPKSLDPNADTIELIKKATVDQLQKMGINFENRNQNEKNFTNDHQNNKFISTNLAASPDVSFRMNSVAMKYVSETSPDVEYHNKKSPVNDVSFRSNCNNVSIATLQYMERYQLLPNSDQRYGGNSIGFNKHEQHVAQEHRHRTLKPNQNNDKSFIY